MAKRKDPSPLFEIIHNAGRPSEPHVRIPDWLRKQQEAQGRAEERSDASESEPAAEPERAPEPAEGHASVERGEPAGQAEPGEPSPPPEPPEEPVVSGSLSVSAAHGEREAGASAEGGGEEAPPPAEPSSGESGEHPVAGDGWLAQPVDLRLTHGRLVAMGGIVAVVLVATFMLGRMVGRETAQADEQSIQSQVDQLQRNAGPIEKGLISDSVRGVEPGSESSGGSTSTVLSPGNDPREAGLNYFRLETVPDNGREAGRAAVRFLRRNGVDAALIPINNGNSLKLVALRGFESPFSDPAAKRFKRKLESLGREWKTQHGGSSDWMDLIAEKYRPGVN